MMDKSATLKHYEILWLRPVAVGRVSLCYQNSGYIYMWEPSVIKAAVIFNKGQHGYHNSKKVTKGQRDMKTTTESGRLEAFVSRLSSKCTENHVSAFFKRLMKVIIYEKIYKDLGSFPKLSYSGLLSLSLDWLTALDCP